MGASTHDFVVQWGMDNLESRDGVCFECDTSGEIYGVIGTCKACLDKLAERNMSLCETCHQPKPNDQLAYYEGLTGLLCKACLADLLAI